jgi:regulator of cell morphogenesis and NO signaling
MLLETLGMHNMKEEQILYPSIDHAINELERSTVFTTMNSLPEERYKHCCQPPETQEKLTK